MKDIWRPVLWSLLAAYEGRFPNKNHWNEDWAEHSFEYKWQNKELVGGFCLPPW